MSNSNNYGVLLLIRAINATLRFLVGPVTFVSRGGFPYVDFVVKHSVRYITYFIVGIPIIILALLISSISVGFDELLASLTMSAAFLSNVSREIVANLHYIAIVISLYYSLMGVIQYTPHDDLKEEWRTMNAPDGPYQWEYFAIALIPVSAVSVTFSLAYLYPEVVKLLPSGIIGLSSGSILLFTIPLVFARKVFFNQWNKSDSDEYPLELERLKWESSRTMGIFSIGLLVLSTEWASTLLGVATTELLFYYLFFLVLGLLRRFRWMLYEDRDGLVNIKPRIQFWGLITRTPFVYAGVVVLFGGFESAAAIGYPIVSVLLPVIAGPAYLGFRYIRTNQDMYRVLPRSKWSPDDVDYEEYIRDSPMLSHAQSQALRPENKLWVYLNKASGQLRNLNREIGSDIEPIDPIAIAKLSYKTDSSYNRRSERIETIKSELGRVESDIQTETDELDDSVHNTIEEVKTTIETAESLNEEVGTRVSGKLSEMLFD